MLFRDNNMVTQLLIERKGTVEIQILNQWAVCKLCKLNSYRVVCKIDKF